MMWGPRLATRDLARLREISAVLIRHGLGDLVRRTGLAMALERAGELLHWTEVAKTADLEPEQRVRMALEDLGPTFVKLGQVLSTRPDLLPPRWIAELERLHSDVQPVPFDALLPQVEETLGRSPFEVFARVQRQPFAAASIAQVHRATLANGAEVVMKVRRPGIVAKVEADLRLLDHLAQLVESELPEARRYAPVRIVSEFRRSLERELDLALEARNIERFARNFAGDPNVLIPKLYSQWTSGAMNVQEYMEGVRGGDPGTLAAAGLDCRVLASRGADAVLKMILVDGFFHADPHPGNVVYLPGNRIALIDFGMVGRLTPERRHQIVDLLAGIVRQDSEAMLETLLDWTGARDVDETALAADVGELVFDFADLELKDLRITVLLQRVTAVLREHAILLPPDLTMMIKALITLEGLGRQYDPEFRLIERVRPFLDQALSERYQPAQVLRSGQAALTDVFSLITSVPRDLARLVKDARHGRMRVDLDLKRLDAFGDRVDGTINRMTIGIMTASLVIGSSIVMTVGGGPNLFGLPVFTLLGLFGYCIAFVNSLWVIVSIWRSGRRWPGARRD
jgi:ubiquinone biosynthesis protein